VRSNGLRAQRAVELTRRRAAALSPSRLELEDQSVHHIGHAGHDARGESHFALTSASAAFIGQSRLARQRAVYALTIKALAPGEG